MGRLLLHFDRRNKVTQESFGTLVESIATIIDHTLLRPDATPGQTQALCKEAKKWGFATVCVHPSYVGLAATELANTAVGISTTVGFPFGANHTEVKAAEARRAVADGATELDMVIAIGRLKAAEFEYVRDDISAVVTAAQGRLVKVILETALLEAGEISRGCQLVLEARAGFVKTSTGFGPGGATTEAVALLRQSVGDKAGVKAAGGIRDAATARMLVAAGATRLGTSASLAIVAGWNDLP